MKGTNIRLIQQMKGSYKDFFPAKGKLRDSYYPVKASGLLGFLLTVTDSFTQIGPTLIAASFMILLAWLFLRQYAGVEPAEQFIPAWCAPVVCAIGLAPIAIQPMVIALIRRKEHEQNPPAQ